MGFATCMVPLGYLKQVCTQNNQVLSQHGYDKQNEPLMTDEHNLRVTFQGRTYPAAAYLDDI